MRIPGSPLAARGYSGLQCMPPSPEVMASLYMEYLRVGKPQGLTFFQYIAVVGYANPAHNKQGMDDASQLSIHEGHIDLIQIPQQPLTGNLHVKVLLVDFPDRQGVLPAHHYEDLLFSQGTHPTGSMYDYYREVSLGKVDVTGSVDGWLRLPQPYSFYTNNESGIFGQGASASYPRNAQRMAEDAVRAAQQFGVNFELELDALNQGTITALFIIHAGRGAEEMHPAVRRSEIWSHKWNTSAPIAVAPGLSAYTYLAVPNDCKVGVCAHELGHLAFQWQDFYDPNGSNDGKEWAGTGDWDLMAGGSWNGSGVRPAHPAGLHKLQHGWIDVDETIFVQGAPRDIAMELEPYTAVSGKVVKIVSPHFNDKQYLLLENRKRAGFDTDLPGEGLLVWRVDERMEMFQPGKPGLLLIQADGLHKLEAANWDQGDAGDPFPGSAQRTTLTPLGDISTSFPSQPSSNVTLDNIQLDSATGRITLDVRYDGA